MITPAYSLTATERVLPKLALDFTTASLDPRVTFTRSGNTATVVNSSGLVAAINADLPRFDYDPTTLACKGLLIEEARTNICLQSQDMATTWSAIAGTVNANQAVSPDGTQNADELVAPNGSAATLAQTISTTITAYGWSVFAKSNGLNTLRLYSRFNPQNDVATFNLATQTATVNAGGTSAKIEDYGNGWYRCSAVFTPTLASATNSYRFITEAGNGVKSVYLWGAQLEAGAFATSYIPTTSAALTRNADVATMTGTNFSDWFNASEGTFQGVIERYAGATNVAQFIKPYDGTANNSYLMFVSNGNYRTLITTANASQGQLLSGVSGPNFNAVLAYKENNVAMAANAAGQQTDATVTLPSVNQMLIGNSEAVDRSLNGHFQQLNYWPQRLTNAEVLAFSK